MDIIHLLPDSVANQIAAGEVVQRPASLVKELVENSLDAGATIIQVVVQDAGATLLQVIDDGKGMSETDARMAFERHATSKIASAADLYSLHTMGFRGEALASIVAVAQVELRTRRPEDELGTLLEMAGSQVIRQEPVQCDAGTSLAVKNLFFNTPARRRFLKSNATEFKNILNEFYRIVLVNPQCAFRLINDGELVFDLPACTTKQRIDAIFSKISKKQFAQNLLTVEVETGLCKLRGYVGTPASAQKAPHQYFFVNNRYMRHPYFHKAVMQAYQGMLRPDVMPHYFLYFDIDPQAIDVNIHPTKTEIKFADEQSIWPILMAAVKETLGKYNAIPPIDFDEEGSPFDIPQMSQRELSQLRPPQTNLNPDYNPFTTSSATPSSPKAQSYQRRQTDWEQLYENFERKTDSESVIYQSKLGMSETFTESASNSTTGAFIIEDNALVIQLEQHYLLTPTRQGLLVVDQHRAHIRVLYEHYLAQLELHQCSSQQLLFPESWDLSPDQMALLSTLLDELKAIGFDLTCFGANSYQVNGIPSDLNVSEAIATLNDMLLAASDATSSDIRQSRRENMALALAEHAAIPYGRSLSQQEMITLLQSLMKCSQHAMTPAGKRILAIQTTTELAKLF